MTSRLWKKFPGRLYECDDIDRSNAFAAINSTIGGHFQAFILGEPRLCLSFLK